MSDKQAHPVHDESLSALMDGEAQELELRRLLQQLLDNHELRAKWSRYQLASSILHKQPHSRIASFNLADAVQLAIQQDVSIEKNTAGGWQKSAMRFAVAASVALVVVTGVQWQQHAGLGNQSVIVMQPANQSSKNPTSLEAVASVPLLVSQPSRDNSSGRYMQNNLEHASLNTSRSMVPLAPVAERKIIDGK